MMPCQEDIVAIKETMEEKKGLFASSPSSNVVLETPTLQPMAPLQDSTSGPALLDISGQVTSEEPRS